MRSLLLWSFGVWLAVSAAYLVCFVLSFGMIAHLQAWLFPYLSPVVSILYLPHGVRVLAAWLYGWFSVVLLAPVTLLVYHLLAGTENCSVPTALGLLTTLLAPPTAFALLRLVKLDVRPGRSDRLDWRAVIAGSALASILNATVPAFFFEVRGADVIAYLVGDMLGAVVLMLILMFGFRWLRMNGR